MSTHEQQTSTIPTSVVRNTRGKSGPQNLEEPASNEALRELCDKNYHQLLPLIAEKMQKEKEQQDKLKAVKARLLYGNESGRNPRNHEESRYSKSKTPTAWTEPRKRHGRNHSRSPSPVASGTEVLARKHHHEGTLSRRTSRFSESEDSERGHWKSKSKRHRTRMPSHVKTYDGSGDLKDHIKLFQSAAKTERWAMPTWCHMFNSTLTGNARVWFDKLPKESIDSYEDLRAAFRENYRQQTKHIKDPVEIHHIKQRDGESTEDFMERYKEEVLDVEGAPECMKISGFMHGITHPELIKRLYERIPRSMDEMYRVTTSFLQGEVAAFSHGRKKAPMPWKQPEGGNKPSFKKGFKNKHRSDRKPDRFSLLTKTPKEIFALEKGKFKAPPPMVTPAEKRDPNKYCEFHADTGHSTDECMQLRKQIDEMIKAGKLSQFIKELKQNDKPKAPKKGETAEKERPLAILMIQPWEKVAKQKVTQSFSPETTISFPPLGDEDGTKGPMIIEAEIGRHFVHRLYVDRGASSEILYEHRFVRLRPEIRSQMVLPTTYLTGFSGETIWPLGQISLLVKLGRPSIRKIRAIPSMAHGMLKFPVEGGTITLKSSRIIPIECVMISGPSTQPPKAGKILKEKIRVAIHPEQPKQTIVIGSTLTEKGRKELCTLLGQNLDVFAWKPADMTGVPRSIAEHCLNIREGCRPVRQKKRGQAPERNKAIQEEVEKLVDAGIMKEVHYHSWLSNPVMVKKHDGTWRMCVDFKDLNNACPKDCYPLPEIDWKIESLCGYPFKCFLDAYKGYHQIKMAKEDEEKTAFTTSQGIFCYSKMPFGLKNAGATYQRLVDKAFQRQIGRNLEVYVDDLVIKSRTEEEIIRDITETFKTLRQINMKLNPKKCSFGMQEGMFLGYKVNTDGLKVCPEKADAVLSLPSPRCLKDVQKLNGKLASLNRFLSKSAEKSLPFFKTLKKCTKKSDFQWTQEAEAAFKQMKKLIAELPMLTAPKEKEELIVYLAAAKEAISAVLMTDREGKQVPVYFVSRALRGPEINYTPMEKLVLALLSASKRLKRYFQAHTIVVITSRFQTNKATVVRSSEISGRMLKWKFELEGYDIQYRPRTAIKGQILADFIVEQTEEESPDELLTEQEELPEPWTLFTDGSSCVDGSGAGLILINLEGAEFTYAMRFRFEATNNEAEYETLIAGLRIAEQMGVKNLQAHVYSRLVANQVNGSYVAKESGMIQYLNKEKSKNEKEILAVVEEDVNTWMTPICEYLTKEILLADKKKARAVHRKAAMYTMINGTLYKKSFLGPWLWCVRPLQANYVLREIHEGSCSMYSCPRSVVAKAIRTGYYWPTMHEDARKLIRECNDCQIHRPIPRNPQQNITHITSPWPFYKWGIDIAGPFPEGPGKVKFLIVAIDYFTKWIEAKPVATITGNQVKNSCGTTLSVDLVYQVKLYQTMETSSVITHSKTGVKTIFDERSKDWIGELSLILWSHRTMIKSSNRETPFSLTYGTEAVILAEIGMPTLRTMEVDPTKNDEALEVNLDLIEEKREQAAIQEAKNKTKMEKYYNSRVRGTSWTQIGRTVRSCRIAWKRSI
ncbi:reverse transcriptase domain-containing protein [Tanacetum coccineum]